MVRRSWHTCQPIDLHRIAKEYFLAAKRIELQGLAQVLGISRATAYRWAGSAEQLVGEVVASLIEDSVNKLAEQTRSTSTGSDRIASILSSLLEESRTLMALNSYLRHNPKQGLKVVASDHGPVRHKTAAIIEALLEAEIENGNLTLNASAPATASLLTRLLETFLYSDTIVNEQPDSGHLVDMVKTILSEPVPAKAAS